MAMFMAANKADVIRARRYDAIGHAGTFGSSQAVQLVGCHGAALRWAYHPVLTPGRPSEGRV